MFTVKQPELVAGLIRIQHVLCAYRGATRCDCKYGAQRPATGHEAGNGCPETMLASLVVGLLTPAEYAKVLKRMGRTNKHYARLQRQMNEVRDELKLKDEEEFKVFQVKETAKKKIREASAKKGVATRKRNAARKGKK